MTQTQGSWLSDPGPVHSPSARVRSTPLPVGRVAARSSLLGEFISQTMFPHGELLAEGGREVLCELLKSENRKEVSRNLKQDKLITLWPKGSCGLAGL